MKNRFDDWKPPEMTHGQPTKWWWFPYHPDKITIGKNVDIGAFTCLFGHYGIELEENVQIGSHCSLYSLNTENNTQGKITIKKGALIGDHCTIYPSVIIEEGEEIHAHSLVYMKDGKRIIKGLIKIETEVRVCIFGGTGTIGSLLVERLLQEGVDSIRVMCNNENELWEAMQKWIKYPMIRYLLGDIRDHERVKKALKNIDYAFNCAAIKHVPFAEQDPIEAVKTNVLGLENIINACVIQKVKSLFHVSTDKACEATNVMGATKFIGERLCQVRAEQNSELRIICIRSGNIENSRGSFTTKLDQAKQKGDPISLTHPDMKRFFITQEELIEFIMKAFREGSSGEIWIPKLEERKIMDLIGDYPYIITGIRKGEKLEEKLINEEEKMKCKEYETYWVIPNAFN